MNKVRAGKALAAIDEAQRIIGPLVDAMFDDRDVDPGYGEEAEHVKILLDSAYTNLRSALNMGKESY